MPEAESISPEPQSEEAGPAVNNEEYIQHHPGAIEDRDKAEYIAHATKSAEEAVIINSKKVPYSLDQYAAALGDDNIRGSEMFRHKAVAESEAAAAARARADAKAEEVSSVYDRTQDNLRSANRGVNTDNKEQ